MKISKNKKKKTHRHKWGQLINHGWEDGTYQTCETGCGAIKFKSERYSYGSRWKK